MILLSVLLTATVHSGFIWLTVFIGVNLIQSALTGISPARGFLKNLAFNNWSSK